MHTFIIVVISTLSIPPYRIKINPPLSTLPILWDAFERKGKKKGDE